MSFGRIFSEYPLVWLLALAGLAVVWTRQVQRAAAVRWPPGSPLSFARGCRCRASTSASTTSFCCCPPPGCSPRSRSSSSRALIAAVRDLRVVRALPFVAIAAWGAVAIANGRAYYLDDPPDEVSRMMYRGEPVRRGQEIGARIAADTAPIRHHRHSRFRAGDPRLRRHDGPRPATCTCIPSSNRSRHNLRMQREMIAEIEAASPKYLVSLQCARVVVGQPRRADRHPPVVQSLRRDALRRRRHCRDRVGRLTAGLLLGRRRQTADSRPEFALGDAPPKPVRDLSRGLAGTFSLVRG